MVEELEEPAADVLLMDVEAERVRAPGSEALVPAAESAVLAAPALVELVADLVGLGAAQQVVRVAGPRIAARAQVGLHLAVNPAAANVARGNYSSFKASSTSSACSVTFTFGNTCVIFPFLPMMKVVRSIPMYFLPYIDFSFQTS